MKAVVYSTQSFEKEFLAKANKKNHDITLISNALGIDTVNFAEGKDAVIVFINDDVSSPVIKKLKEFGIKYIATRSSDTTNIDIKAASAAGMKVANVPQHFSNQYEAEAYQKTAEQIIKNLNNWQANKCAGKACACANACQKNNIPSKNVSSDDNQTPY
ncbi:MAG: lactate dehydrogenase [Oligoflexus sp.]|nr:lactate dehydrogenase [Pseudopedobacter sp.]